MFNILFGIALIAATLAGYVNVLGSTIPPLVFGGLAILNGIRKMILKAKRREREKRLGHAY
jgi:uncharacterized membrane protein HdeD (DUF308 family)